MSRLQRNIGYKSGRIFYADCLRAAATFAVVVLHVASASWGLADVRTFEWQTLNVYNTATRFCVPIFLMLSGMLFLNPDKKIDIRDIFFKYIPRIAMAFLFWSFLYNSYDAGHFTFSGVFTDYHYHLWYLYVIIGLYLVVPLVRHMVNSASRREVEYFLLLSFFFTFVVKTLSQIPTLEWIADISDKFEMHYVIGYMGYFVWGYYLHTYYLGKFQRKMIYICGVMGFLETAVLSGIVSVSTDMHYQLFYSNFSVGVLLMSVAIFVLFKYNCDETKAGIFLKNRIISVAKCSFGMYLVHDFFNILFGQMGYTALTFNPVFCVLPLSAAVSAASYLVSIVMSKIPFFRSYTM
ncbi:MAG: acyltransferase family protein [Clostridia bacterium]|nr:acyltransferase family protein [Clostridia bacterium]